MRRNASSTARTSSVKPEGTSRLASAGMHLEMRIALEQILHRNERAPVAERDALLGAAIGAAAPALGDHRRQFAGCDAAPQRTAQIHAVRGVEAEIPDAVRREPAAIARTAKRPR